MTELYKPLPHKRCTRVLGFRPVPNEAVTSLVLHMSVLDLDKQTEEYDALSYTWGAPLSGLNPREYSSADDVEITIVSHDEQYTVSIGRNLYEALLQLQHDGQSRSIWVDSICINQADLREKESHILLMCDVYSKAKLVVVWLGREDTTVPEVETLEWFHGTVFDQLQKYIEEHGLLVHGSFGVNEDDQCITIIPMSNFRLPYDRLKVLYRFYARRRYFGRAWVVQEVALAQECIVCVGKSKLDFERMIMLPRWLNMPSLGGASHILQDPGQANEGGGSEVVLLGVSAAQMQNWSTSTLRSDLAKLHGCYDDRTTYIAYLEYRLTLGTPRVATDPRDIIYSLLGMAEHLVRLEVSPVPPDYSATTATVYTRFTEQLLLTLPNRVALSAVRFKPESGYCTELPSWVPDYATIANYPQPLQANYMDLRGELPPYRAALASSEPTSISLKNDQLTLYARRCTDLKLVVNIAQNFQDLPGLAFPDLMVRGLQRHVNTLQMCVEMRKQGRGDAIVSLLSILGYGELDAKDADTMNKIWKHYNSTVVWEARRTLAGDAQGLIAQILATMAQLDGESWIPTADELQLFADRMSYLGSTTSDDYDTPDWQQRIHELWPEAKNTGDDAEMDIVQAFGQQFLHRPDIMVTEHDNFFITSNGLAGRIANDVQQDDELWLICQAKVPFILRRRDDGMFTLIQEAYVEGAMFGELIENGTAGEPELVTIV